MNPLKGAAIVVAIGCFGALGAVTLLSSCTSQKKADPESALGLAAGKPIFDFNYKQTQELEIVSHDRNTGLPWTARIASLDSGDWRILHGPADEELSDRLADSTFILHLMDTFTTLQFFQKAGQGPLASFGLEPPQHIFRWKAGKDSFEIHFGKIASTEEDQYALIKQHPRLKASETAEPFVIRVKGAALLMLSHLNSFRKLREQKLLSFSLDDVDLLESREMKLEREGTEWVKLPKRKRVEAAPELLKALFHLRIKDFSEPRPQPKSPLYRIQFEGRTLEKTDLVVAPLNGQVLAWVGNRPGATFILHPESLRVLQMLLD